MSDSLVLTGNDSLCFHNDVFHLWDGMGLQVAVVRNRDIESCQSSDRGSAPADVTAELVWVGDGEPKDFEGLDVKDKILVTSGSAGTVHNIGCVNKGAAGVISFSSPRPLFDPLIIPWGGLYARGGAAKFAFPAASNARGTIAEVATMVRSRPSRTILLWLRGTVYISSGTSPRVL